jgi:beta-mannosidase
MAIALSGLPTVDAGTHSPMSNHPPATRRLMKRDDSREIVITNMCSETVYPAISTQAGTGPKANGFLLASGNKQTFTVSANWQGRVWGRSNCSFNAAGTGPPGGGIGKACFTGDCNGAIDCKLSVSELHIELSYVY